MTAMLAERESVVGKSHRGRPELPSQVSTEAQMNLIARVDDTLRFLADLNGRIIPDIHNRLLLARRNAVASMNALLRDEA